MRGGRLVADRVGKEGGPRRVDWRLAAAGLEAPDARQGGHGRDVMMPAKLHLFSICQRQSRPSPVGCVHGPRTAWVAQIDGPCALGRPLLHSVLMTPLFLIALSPALSLLFFLEPWGRTHIVAGGISSPTPGSIDGFRYIARLQSSLML